MYMIEDFQRGNPNLAVFDPNQIKFKDIRAYHSSPHDFDRFDLSKIGTGEGAQTYGHGLYFAENPAVSGQGASYWNQFLNKFRPDERLGAEFLQSKGFDRNAALADNEQKIARLREFYKDSPAEAAPAIARLMKQSEEISSGKTFGPRTYEVNINADPAQMLDWDKPLREQPGIIPRLEAAGMETRDVSVKPGFYDAVRTPEGIARLNEAGIPGIKYLDQGSRAAGTGSSNYVVFDPKIIDIMKKYGLAGLAPLGAAGIGAAQPQQPQQGL
jgi:hypothetical protein